jgi:hypothetical protein
VFIVVSVVSKTVFAQFRSGSSCVDTSHLSSEARRGIIDETVKKVFQSAHLAPPEGSLHLSLKGRRLTVLQQGVRQEIELSSSQREEIAKVLQRSMSFARTTRFSMAPDLDSSVAPAAEMAHANHPNRLPAAVRAVGPTAASISLTRNLLSLGGMETPFVDGLGVAGGILGAGIGAVDWKTGLGEHERAQRAGDGEGYRRAEGRILYGQTEAASAVLFLAEEGCAATSTESAAAAGAAIGTAALFFSGIASIVGCIMSLLGIYRCSIFKDRIRALMNHPSLSEEQRLFGAIGYLQELISITSEERLAIEKKVDAEHPKDREQRILEENNRLIEKKIAWLKRRTSAKSVEMILGMSGDILEKMQNPATRSIAIKEAKSLIGAIEHDISVKMLIHSLGLAASLLGIAALIVGMVCTGGLAPLILTTIAAVLWLALALYNVIAPLFQKNENIAYGALPAADGQHISVY